MGHILLFYTKTPSYITTLFSCLNNMTARRKNPKLWDEVKDEVNSDGTRWNARKAQQAVKLYKKRGGKYIGVKSAMNSLVKWTNEDWGYVDPKNKARYLPKKIRTKLTAKEKNQENKRKKKVGFGKNAAWSKKVAKLYNEIHK